MLTFMVNNRAIQTELPPGSALVDFLRNDLHLYGTKIGCREGDCGACTVLVGEWVDGRMRYQGMASCLMPLVNADGKHIVTIEGINGPRLTVIQALFAEQNATQCGFCTPGFILSLYAFCLGDQPLTLDRAIEAVSGNICRCTGYASIKRAIEALVARVQPLDRREPLAWLVAQGFLPEYFQTIPERMRALAAPGPGTIPVSGYLIGGGTDLLIQDFDRAHDATGVRSLAGADALRRIVVADGRGRIGAACTLTQVKESESLRAYLPALGENLALMASKSIRNMGTVGGNLANASPLGDLCVILMGLDATLELARAGQRRELKLRDFYTGYKRSRLEPDEIIEQVSFALPGPGTRFSFEKISKRTHLDMATVNSAMRVELDRGVVRSASFAAGSLGPTVLHLGRTCAYLVGKPLDNATFREANRIAQTEIAPVSRHPGDGDYKRLLLRQQLLIHLMRFSPDTVTPEACQ